MDVFRTAEDILNEKGSEILSIGPDAVVENALSIMAERNVGCILIRSGSEYVGVWTERDLMKNVLVEGFDIHTAKIGDYMTRDLIYAQHNDIIYNMIDQFLGRRIRHLLIQRKGQFIGLLSTGDVMRAGLQQRTEELEQMRNIVTLDYYDKWRRKKKGRS
jgi:signal-transduction protein with cAMP-binding, CBS, and nucleotidyltransferase domain